MDCHLLGKEKIKRKKRHCSVDSTYLEGDNGAGKGKVTKF
jgi:hypothetical protein